MDSHALFTKINTAEELLDQLTRLFKPRAADFHRELVNSKQALNQSASTYVSEVKKMAQKYWATSQKTSEIF